MDRIAAQQYHKTLSELFLELKEATTPQLRAPILARMHNILFPLYVVDTHAAQHAGEALTRLREQDAAIVNAAHTTLAEALTRFAEAIDKHPDEPFVVFGEDERRFARAVSHEELEGLRTHGRLFAPDFGPYVTALDAKREVERVLREADPHTLATALGRVGFEKPEAVAFFATRAHPKLGKPAEKIPSMTICTMRAGIPITLLDVRELDA